MGWKSTIDITRDEAISAIIVAVNNKQYEEMSNEELKDLMYGLNIGDDVNLPYFGHNFSIVEDEKN
jgi:hypothetical protein